MKSPSKKKVPKPVGEGGRIKDKPRKREVLKAKGMRKIASKSKEPATTMKRQKSGVAAIKKKGITAARKPAAMVARKIKSIKGALINKSPVQPATTVVYELKEATQVNSLSEEDGFYTGLLDRARIQWLMGDWEGLSKIDLEQIEHHPDRAKIALLASAGLMQAGEDIKAQQFIRIARDWGVSKKLACNILAAGMHNNLGRAAVVSGNQILALKHFEKAIVVGNHSSEKNFLAQARISEKYKRIAGTASQTHLIEVTDKKSNCGLDNNDVASFQEKLKNAKEARAGKDFDHAEALLQEVLGDDPKNVDALQELGRLKSAQQQWIQAVDVYNRLLKTQNIALEAILARARMRLNTGEMQESIAELEKAKALGFESTSLTHQLAVAYRDDRQWEAAEEKIDEILQTDARYANKKIAFATFAADVLRKRDRVKEAQTLLQGAVNAANAKGVTIPLNTSAILLELNLASKQPHTCLEVSKYFYDGIYEQSEKYQVDPEHSVYLPVWEKVCDALKARGALRVLDIGCGPGQFAQYLNAQIPDLEYIGVDYSQTAIREAKRKCPSAHFFERDLTEDNALAEFQADACIMLEVLEHIEDDCEMLARVPGGQWVVMSVPNFDSFGHVRFFENEDEVMARYAAIFEDFRSETIELRGRTKIFLVSGMRSGFVAI
jgi:predicted TPR repeat methyltransferase